MSDRSEEVTEPRSTDDLLEETERLLSGSNADDGSSGDPDPAPDRSASAEPDAATVTPGTGADAVASGADAAPDASSSRLSRLAPGLSPGRYFSPKAFLALVLALGAGLVVGGMTVPIGGVGRIVGMFAVAFLAGLVSSRRRYLEVTVAGGSIGVASALANYAMFMLAGSGRTVIAVGAAIGLLSCVGGYYFGRDLRNGLARDVE
ncbi:DUF456 domain-containing protein [Halosolutus gelatinilyticus]|uniref:DUF456 domain-containing protein n=1 Tax=Halosolutus gelatinilyticus TaxID=2931975 RepID=UPI001FF315E6|nr:DUF456 domain-containing protein [Halosolutus gelatinilyticus]